MVKRFKSRPIFSNAVPKSVRKPKIEWKAFPVIWHGLKRTAMVLGFLVLFQIFVALIILPGFFQTGVKPLPKEMVLFLSLDEPLYEVVPTASLSDPFAPPPLTVREVVETLDRAAGDARVKGLVVRLDGSSMSYAQAQEIRSALARFKAAEKFAYAYASSYGDAGGGLGRYYLASAFDQIWMQPLGIVMVNGLSAEMPFLRGVLDKIGAEPDIYKRKDYKTAYENVTDRRLSKENREMTERLIGDIRAAILRDVPQGRMFDEKEFARFVDQGLFTAKEAIDAKLITHADYADVMVENITEFMTGDRDGEDDFFVSFDDYASRAAAMNAGPKVALVYIAGAIMKEEGRNVAASKVIAPAILKASRDDAIDAIVLRVDSPGGSPVASESILRAAQKAQEAGKPVIVSMGSVAASGGYWVAASADQIFVLPSTITGSIGVVGGKFSLAGLWQKLGVNWDGVQWGENADIWSFNEKFSERGAERVNAMLDNVYRAFITRVAKGRKMGLSEVDKIAGGRVWSGARAVEIGLADQIGGLDAALDYTAELLDVEGGRQELDVLVFPKPKTPIEQLIALLEGQAVLGQSVRENATLLELLAPVSDAAMRVQNPHGFLVFEDFYLR